MHINKPIRSFRASVGRRCYPMFLRNSLGQVVRLLSFTDYQACAHGGEPREFIKILTHSRYALGCLVPKGEQKVFVEQIIPALAPGVWTEVVIK